MIWHKKLKLKRQGSSSSGSTSSRKSQASNNSTKSTTSKSRISPTTTTIMDHSHSEDQLWGAVEIIPQRLYYAPLKFFPPNQDDEDEDDEQSEGESDGDDQKPSAIQQRQQQGGISTSTSASNQPSSTKKTKKKKPIHYFSIDNELIYWNFFLDFGPLNLGQLYRFASKLNAKLSSREYKDCIICYYSGAKGEARANAVYLICAWSMLFLGRGLDEAYFGFMEEFALETSGSGRVRQRLDGLKSRLGGNTSLPPQLRSRHSMNRASSSGSTSSRGSTGSSSRGGEKPRMMLLSQQKDPSPFARLHPLPPFHDASPIVCTYDLSVYDCLQGLEKARRFGFFKFGNAPPYQPRSIQSDASMEGKSPQSPSSTTPTTTKPPFTNPSTFNPDEYEYFEQVENGDLNWIVQNKILAFAGPQNQKLITPEGFCMLTPSDYIPYFLKQKVKIVIRLNKKCYNEQDFEKVGIRHVEHYYLDGSCPPLEILHAVIEDMESIADDEAMAVHCKAGLGRTGTCIGAYLMKHYRFTAKEVIGWMRICRPGMVIGPQQHFLADIEGLMWQEGEAYRGTGLRKMSIGSGDNCEEDEEQGKSRTGAMMVATTPARVPAAAAAVVSPESMGTPQAKSPPLGSSGSPLGGGAHVSIVTPDGKPLHLPTTPVVARKLDVDTSDMMVISPTAHQRQQQQRPLSSSSSLPTMDALKVKSSSSIEGMVAQGVMQEGDQANALLSRRLDQYQARHSHHGGGGAN